MDAFALDGESAGEQKFTGGLRVGRAQFDLDLAIAGAGGHLNCIIAVRAPVAQLDRATGFEPVGRVFESPRAHQPYFQIVCAAFVSGFTHCS